jgi:hypothetical protein
MKICMKFKHRAGTPYKHRGDHRRLRRRLRPMRTEYARVWEIWDLRRQSDYGHAESYAKIKMAFDGLEF